MITDRLYKRQNAQFPVTIRELNRLMQLGLPLVGAQLAQISINTMDVLMISWLSPEDLAASVLAFNVYAVLWLTGLGVIQAAAPLTAQAYGGGNLRMMRRVIRQAVWIAAIYSVISLLLLEFITPILLFLGQEVVLVEKAEVYTEALKWAFFPGLAMICLRIFIATLGFTTFYFWSTIFMAVLNGVLNYGLIFGNLGLPRLELVGAGIASAISATVTLILIIAYILLHRKLKRYVLFGNLWRTDLQLLKQIVVLGLPIGMALLSEVAMFSVASVMMGWIGVNELAAHAIVAQCAAVTFMIPLGLGQAAVVRVGISAGRGNIQGIRTAGWTAMAAGTAIMAVSAALFWFIPESIISLYQDESDPVTEVVLAVGVSFMLIAAVFQFADGAQVICQCALRGLNDTKVPMYYAIFGYWFVGIGSGYVLAFPLKLGGVGIWLGLALGLTFVAIALTHRFMRRESLGLVAQFQSVKSS